MAAQKALVDIPASRWTTLFSLLIDLSTLVGAGCLMRWITASILPDNLSITLTALTVVLILAFWTWLRRRHGTSLGHALLGLRAVSSRTQLPGRFPSFQAVNTRRGSDPLRPRPRAVVLDWDRGERPTSSTSLPPVLVGTLDDGSTFQILPPCVIGRLPKAPTTYNRVSVTDIQRTISRTHVALWFDGRSLVIQDLGSHGGTAQITPTGEIVVLPHEPFKIPLSIGPVAQLRLGSRVLSIEAIPTHTGA